MACNMVDIKSAHSALHVVRLCNANLKKIITQEGQLHGGFSHRFSAAHAFLLALFFRFNTGCLLVHVQGSAQLASPARQPQNPCITCTRADTHHMLFCSLDKKNNRQIEAQDSRRTKELHSMHWQQTCMHTTCCRSLRYTHSCSQSVTC